MLVDCNRREGINTVKAARHCLMSNV